jgi:pimeloyl-ACP methyl ester carboxylesterase
MQKILLLHGALGSKAQLKKLSELLSTTHEVHSFNFSGHGGRAIDRRYRIESFAQELSEWMHAEKLQGAVVFGYSMGGYVALRLASEEPGLISKIVTLGTKFDWNPEAAARETRMLNPAKIAEKVPKFAAALEARHAPADWQEVLRATAEMMLALGESPSLDDARLAGISIPCLIQVGEHDNMVTEAESQAAAAALPNSGFVRIPGFKHPIEQVDPEELARRIRDFVDS